MHAYILVATLGISAKSLWARRHTWGNKWDGATTNSIVLLSINVLMMTPEINLQISPHLYRALGVWNLEQLFGHICYIGALMGFLTMGAMRLKMTDRQRQKFLRRNIQLVGTLYVPIAIAAFVWGGGEGENLPDLVLDRPNPKMFFYWGWMGIVSLYLTVLIIKVLRELRRNPASRYTSNLFLAGTYLSLLGIVFGCITLITPAGAIPMWINIRLELVVFAFAAWESWRQRVLLMDGSHGRESLPA
jgi:hypothetical protein